MQGSIDSPSDCIIIMAPEVMGVSDPAKLKSHKTFNTQTLTDTPNLDRHPISI